MPITRALSARNRSLLQTRPSNTVHPNDGMFSEQDAFDENNGKVDVLKSAATFPAKRSFARTCSMPVLNTSTSTLSDSGVFHSAQSTGATSSKQAGSSQRMCISLSSSSSTGSFSSFSARGRSEDESDEEDDRDRSFTPRLNRLGGCSHASEAKPFRDDSNKENIAPLRRLRQIDIRREQAAQQQDAVIRQTRRRIATPMSDRSDSLPPSTAAAAVVDSSFAPRRSRGSFRRTASTPSIARKRSRSMLEEDSSGNEDDDADNRRRFMSARKRVDLSSSSDDSSLFEFSSQSTSIFDALSNGASSPLSRCTTPDLNEMQEEKDSKDEGVDNESVVDSHSQPLSTSSLPYSNVFVHARSLLRYGVTSEVHIVGRDRERGILQRFLHNRFGLFTHLEHSATPNGETFGPSIDGANDSGSLYVCGLPGTGKTALVRSVVNDLQQPLRGAHGNGNKVPRIAFIDCMTIQHPRELFKRILLALDEDVQSLPSGENGDVEAEQRVTKLVRDTGKRTLIVLDEIDHLLRSRAHQNILYRIFSWPRSNTQACAVIGLANSLDLTERFVPLLASKGSAPAVLHFRPFEAQEIKCVIGSRLAMLRPRYDVSGDDSESTEGDHDTVEEDMSEAVALFSPPALELLARKIAAATGDLRKALDAARLAVEAIEAEATAKSTDSEGESAQVDFKSLTPSTAPKVSPSHVIKVLSAVLGSPQLSKIRSLSLHAKLALLALLVAQKRDGLGLNVLGGSDSKVHTGRSMMGSACSSKGAAAGTMMCDLQSTYTAMLRGDDFAVLEGKELVDVVEGLEVEGMVRITSITGQAASASTTGQPSSADRSGKPASSTGGISPSAKRAAKRQLLASYRRVQLSLSADEVLRGITTVASNLVAAQAASSSAADANQASAGGQCSAVVVGAIRRIWTREETKADQAKGWEASAALAQRVRDEELGGGRGAIGL